jgi:hypothetical protein
VFSNGTRGPGIIAMDDARQRGRFHSRPNYCDVDIAATCRWLNERENGYPTVYVIDGFDPLKNKALDTV